jgi:hypothetical protein
MMLSLFLTGIIYFNLFLGLAVDGAVVTSISPTQIGYGGGTITIFGSGFATDGFSQFDPIKGNKVCYL